jgi:CubicO group peptidase (beta-lactamase class C family)
MEPSTAAEIVEQAFAGSSEIGGVPGVAFGLVHQGRLVHEGGRGRATLDGPVPTADTVFRIASMTKSFTAAAVLLLRDEGALRLDDPVTDHLPFATTLAPADGPPVTIRDLLTMGGGLATDDPWGDRQESLPADQFDAMVAAGLSRCRPARTAFEYSNTGYALLGRVVDEVSGSTYRDLVLERICAPLGMRDTRFDARDVPSERLATGYRLAASGVPVAEPDVRPGTFSAMGGLHSTVRDLATWVGGLVAAWTGGSAGHPVAPWSLREAQELARYSSTGTGTGPAAGTVVLGYGFGLVVEEHEVLGRVVSHSGGYPGFGSHMRWHPASGWGVIALGNASYAPMHAPASAALARIVLESGAAHGSRPAIPPVPWPQTLAAMDLVDDLLCGRADGVTDDVWSPNMDLDIPRDERMAALAALRDAIGAPRRVAGSVEHATPARAGWLVRGDAGSARVDVWMTPEPSPRIQRVVATRMPDPHD